MQPSLIHLEHALPALAELGIEALVPLLGGRFDATTLAGAMQGLASGAEKRAARVLVAVSKATASELLAWENDPSARERALKEAALASFEDAKVAVISFFGSLGISPGDTPGSSALGKSAPAPSDQPSAPVP